MEQREAGLELSSAFLHITPEEYAEVETYSAPNAKPLTLAEQNADTEYVRVSVSTPASRKRENIKSRNRLLSQLASF